MDGAAVALLVAHKWQIAITENCIDFTGPTHVTTGPRDYVTSRRYGSP